MDFVRWPVFLWCALLAAPGALASPSGLSLQPIYFAKGQATLDQAARARLERVMALLQANPESEVHLEGHASVTKGVDADNLSRQRVDAAYGELVKLAKTAKVSIHRIQGRALGSTKPAQLGSPAADANDRVEFAFKTNKALGQAKKKGLETVKVIYWNTLYHSLFQVGVGHGFFENEGFHVQLVATSHSAIDQVGVICGLEPFVEYGKQVFLGGVCGGSPHIALERGIDMVVIGGLLAGGSMLIAKPEMAQKLRASPENFKGITIGRPKGISVTSMIVSGFLKRKGIDHQKDIKWKIYDSHEDVIRALVKGEVDAGDTYAPLHIRSQKEDGLTTVYNTMELFPYHPCSRIIVTRDKLTAHRDKYVRFMRGLINSHQYFIQHPREAMETIRQYTGYAKDEVVGTLTKPSFILDPDPLRNGLTQYWKMVNDTGFVNSQADIRKHIDVAVYEEALTSLMKEQPTNPYYRYMMNKFKQQNL